jgi:hypothetical protein
MISGILPRFITEKDFCKYSTNFLARPALKGPSKSDELETVTNSDYGFKSEYKVRDLISKSTFCQKQQHLHETLQMKSGCFIYLI